MSWMDRKKAGRKPLPEGVKRVQIRPTVSQETRDFLECQQENAGRTIDKLVIIYRMKKDYDSEG